MPKISEKFENNADIFLVLYSFQIQYFTIYMIALANSCQGIMDNMTLIKSQYWRPGGSTKDDTRIATEFDMLSTHYSV